MARILVVKDGAAPLTGRWVDGVFEGHEPYIVPSGQAAVAALNSEAFDAVLLTAPLARVERMALATCLREDSAISRLPVVVLPVFPDRE